MQNFQEDSQLSHLERELWQYHSLDYVDFLVTFVPSSFFENRRWKATPIWYLWVSTYKAKNLWTAHDSLLERQCNVNFDLLLLRISTNHQCTFKFSAILEWLKKGSIRRFKSMRILKGVQACLSSFNEYDFFVVFLLS